MNCTASVFARLLWLSGIGITLGLFPAAAVAEGDHDLVIELPTVSIEATSPIAEETSAPLRRLRLLGRFVISRTGPTNQSLPVFVQYRGTAIPGTDYQLLPIRVTIPDGSVSTELVVDPIQDDIDEPFEVVEATLSNCPP